MYGKTDKSEIVIFWKEYNFVFDSILYSKNKILKQHFIFQNK